MAGDSKKFNSTQASRSENFKKWLNEKLVPAMAKIGNQRHLSSLRDGFAIVTPLIIAAALALVIRTSVFGGAGTEKSSLLGVFASWDASAFMVGAESTSWGKASDAMNFLLYATNFFGLGMISVYFTFGFGYFLARSRGNDSAVIAGLVALGSFFLATIGGQSSASYINASGGTVPLVGSGFMGSEGIFTSIIITIISVELFCYFSTIKRFEIQMPAGVPPAVSRSFAKLLPVVFTAFSMTLLLAIVLIPTKLTQASVLTSQQTGDTVEVGVSQAATGSFWNLGDLLYMAVQAPFIFAATVQGANFGIAILYVFLVGLFWFFGLHGTNVANGIFNAVWLSLLAKNTELVSDPALGLGALKEMGSIFVGGTFDAYIFFGGTGTTITLILATLWLGKRVEERAVARFSLPSGIFNINEPIVFGFPIVANLRWAVPYILVMPVLVVTTYLLHLAFDTTPVFAQIPWTAPAGIGALFATGFDYTSFLIAAINFGVSFVIWFPFVLLSNRMSKTAPEPAAPAKKAAASSAKAAQGLELN